MDLGNLAVQRNAVLLMELHQRAKKGISPIEGIPEYMALMTKMLRDQPIFGPNVMDEV